MTRVLIVEDDPDLAEGLEDNLTMDGYVVRTARTGTEGLAAVSQWAPDVIILDLMLPGLDGYDVLRQIRQNDQQVPVLILSARSSEVEKVRGFRTGADDFVTKPFGLLELISRVDALCRRSGLAGAVRSSDRLVSGDLSIDLAGRIVLKAGEVVDMRPKAFDLLVELLRTPGRVRSRDDLLSRVWHYDSGVRTRTVDWHVAELRRQLEQDPSHPEYLMTVRGSGYRWSKPVQQG